MKGLHDLIRDDHSRTVKLLQQLVGIPSYTGQEQRLGMFIYSYLQEAGFQVKVDAAGNVLGYLRGARPGRSLLLFTHTDTAQVITMKDPHVGQIIAGKEFGKDGLVLRGAGAAAPKGSLAVILEVASRLGALKDAISGELWVAAVSKDMTGNHDGMRELFGSYPITADLAIAGEPTGNELALAAKGLAIMEVVLQGIPSHCGAPNNSGNPVFAAADFLNILSSLNLPIHPNLGPASFTVVGIDSKRTPPTTPEECRLTLDRRILPNEDVEEIRGVVAEIVDGLREKGHVIQGDITVRNTMFPFETRWDERFTIIEQAVRSIGLECRLSYLACACNGGYTEHVMGIPTVALGPGTLADIGEQEHVEVTKLIEGVRMLLSISGTWLGLA